MTALLWRRRKAGDGAQAQRNGWETICGISGLGCVQLMDQDGSGKHHFEPVTHHPSLAVRCALPKVFLSGS